MKKILGLVFGLVFAGLSMAGWNALISLALASGSIFAALRRTRR